MKLELGYIQSPKLEGQRECVHVPCIILRAHGPLQGGEHVKLEAALCNDHPIPVSVEDDYHIQGYDGIVDPFIDLPIRAGDHVAILLRPGKVVNIHHEFDIRL